MAILRARTRLHVRATIKCELHPRRLYRNVELFKSRVTEFSFMVALVGPR